MRLSTGCFQKMTALPVVPTCAAQPERLQQAAIQRLQKILFVGTLPILEKQGGHVVQKILLSMCLLSAMMATAAAQTKPAAGSKQIYWVVTFTVPPGNMDKFKQVVARLVDATKQEPGALEYEYTATSDNGTVDIIERYADADAVVHHVADNFGPNFSKEFLALVKPARFVVYGTPNAKVKEVLAGFNPTYMTPFDGFTR